MRYQQLIDEIGELEALVDICANNQHLQESIELSSVCEVLGVVADRLTTLKGVKLYDTPEPEPESQ